MVIFPRNVFPTLIESNCEVFWVKIKIVSKLEKMTKYDEHSFSKKMRSSFKKA